MSAFHEACRKGNLARVRSLLSEDPSLVDADDEYDWRPIFHAGLCKHVDVTRFLLEQGADLSAHDGYVLHYAAEVPDNQQIVTMLIQYGALESHVQPTCALSRQFLAAIFLNDEVRVQSLLTLHSELAAKPDGRGDMPIHHAARNGSTKIVRTLIASGADVNSANPRGHTVLYCAAGHGHVETVQLLLENGVDVGAVFTEDGKTVAEWLAQYPESNPFQKIRDMLTS